MVRTCPRSPLRLWNLKLLLSFLVRGSRWKGDIVIWAHRIKVHCNGLLSKSKNGQKISGKRVGRMYVARANFCTVIEQSNCLLPNQSYNSLRLLHHNWFAQLKPYQQYIKIYHRYLGRQNPQWQRCTDHVNVDERVSMGSTIFNFRHTLYNHPPCLFITFISFPLH